MEERRGLAWIFVPFGLIAALFLPLNRMVGTLAGTTSRRASTQAAGEPARPSPAALTRTCESCDGGLACAIARSFDSIDSRDYRPESGPSRHAKDLDVIIATVPDPVDSAFDSAFDQSVDAIQQAVESDGYVRDRYWLPWSRRFRGEGGRTPATAKSNTKPASGRSDERRLSDRCYERQPGVIMFRRASAIAVAADDRRRDRVAVLLVGESPIWGVQQDAFRTALEIARAASDDRSGAAAPHIALLGPTFSGTVDSLAQLLAEKCHLRYDIVSGSATAIDQQSFRSRLVHMGCSSDAVSFATMAVPDSALRNGFYRYLARLDGSKDGLLPRVGLLAESDTVYGAPFTKGEPSPPATARPQAPADETAPHPRFIFTFPSHISRVRSEYDREQALPSEPVHSETNVRKTLEYSLAQSRESRDVVPALSDKTAVLVDLELSSTLPALCPNLDYLGVVATDTSDRLFLAHRAKDYCPDVRLFTFDTDVSYTHQAYASDFEGMLIASGYGLERTTFDGGRFTVRPFANDYSIGLFNATLQLLDPGRHAPRMPGLDADHCGLWISTVSRGAFWPVAFLSDARDGLPCYAAPASDGVAREIGRDVSRATAGGFYPLHRPRIGLAVIVVLILATAALVWRYFADALGPSGNRSTWTERWFGPKRQRRYQIPHGRALQILLAVFVVLLYLTLATVYALITYLALVWLRIEHEPAPWPAPLIPYMLLLCLAALGAAFADAILILVHPLPGRPGPHAELEAFVVVESNKHPDPSVRRLVAVGTFGIVLALLLLAAAYTSDWIDRDKLAHRLFFERTAYLSSGVSIFVPCFFLCAAIAILLLSEVKRLWWQFLSDSVAQPFDHCSKFKPVVDTLRLVLAKGGGSARIPAVLALAVLLIWFSRECVHSLEARTWSVLLGIAFPLLLYAIAVDVVWFLVAWHALHLLLIRLPALPFTAALRQLPPSFARDLGRQTYARQLRIADLIRPARVVVQMSARHNLVCRCDWDKTLATAAHTLDKAIDADRADAKALGSPTQWCLGALVRQIGTDCFRLGLDPTTELGATPRACLADAQFTDLLHQYLAIETATYIFFVEMNVRNLFIGSVGALLLVLLAAMSYPFEPHSMLLTAVSGLIVLHVATVLYVLVSMERDETLSLIAGTPVGKVRWNWTFIRQVLLYVIVPLLFVVVAQVPELSQLLSNWVTPFPATPP